MLDNRFFRCYLPSKPELNEEQKRKEQKKMIEIDGKEYRTELQWNQKRRAILDDERGKGILRQWYIDMKQRHMRGARFYCEAQTRPFTQDEWLAFRKERKELAEERKKSRCCKFCGKDFGKLAKYELEGGVCYFCRSEYTAWDLLQCYKIPKADAKAHGERLWEWDAEKKKRVPTDKIRYYYKGSQTEDISEEEYDALHSKFIELFGNIEDEYNECIEWDRTDYDGRKWW